MASSTRADRISYNVDRPDVPRTSDVFSDSTLQSEWTLQSSLYDSYWRWFDGKVYDQHDDIFPLALNPLRVACILHRNALFGEADDTSQPLVRARFAVPPTLDDIKSGKNVGAADGRSRLLSYLVNSVWTGSSGRSLMAENGLVSQILGGCVFGVRYSPWDAFLPLPIRIETISPEEFLPVYVPGDPWHLKECWIVRYLSPSQAMLGYGVDTDQGRAIYKEHWTTDSYEITIDGKQITMVTSDGVRFLMAGRNPFGVVPFVYIPHEREGKQFYGKPVMHQQEGTLEEMNARTSDMGDSVRDSSHQEYWGANLQRAPVKKRLTDRLEVIDLGTSGPQQPEPKLEALDPPKVPEQNKLFVDMVEQYFRNGVFTPDIAYGKDQGSQRSALTLAFRMWPFASHIRQERVYWTDGKNAIDEIIIRIAAARRDDRRLQPYGATEADFNMPKRQEWFPMLPRDVEADVNLDILRHQAGLLDAQTAIERDPEIDNPSEVVERVKAEKADTQRQQVNGQQKGAPTKIPIPAATNDPNT